MAGIAEKSTREYLYSGGETPSSIIFPPLEKPFKLAPGFIQLLPKFYGNSNEDALKHMQEFLLACSTYSLNGVTDDIIKFRAFSFTLHDIAKEWLFNLPFGSINSWDCLLKSFLKKYQSPSVTRGIRKQITSIEQDENESLNDYWDRFNRLCISCPQHQLSEILLIEYFYDGLLDDLKRLIDIASGGSLVDKTPTEARKLISNLAISTPQYGIKDESKVKMQKQLKEQAEQIKELKEVVTSQYQSMNNQHQSLENIVRQLVIQVGEIHAQTCNRQEHLDNQMKLVCTTLTSIQSNLVGQSIEKNHPTMINESNVVTLMTDNNPKKIGEVEKAVEVVQEVLENKRNKKDDQVVTLHDDTETEAHEKESDGKVHTTSRFYATEFDPRTMVPFPSRFFGSRVGEIERNTCERSKVNAMITNEFEDEIKEVTNGECQKTIQGLGHNVNYISNWEEYDFGDDSDDDELIGWEPVATNTKEESEERFFEKIELGSTCVKDSKFEDNISETHELIQLNEISFDPPWGIPYAKIDDYFELLEDYDGLSLLDVPGKTNHFTESWTGTLSEHKPLFSVFESANLSSIDKPKYFESNIEFVNMEQFYEHREWRETLFAKFEYHLPYCLCILLLLVSKLLLHHILSAREMALATNAFKGLDPPISSHY